jgi:hypothetical protein
MKLIAWILHHVRKFKIMSEIKYTLNEIMDKYYEMKDSQKVQVLSNALSEMGSYNGRSNNYCIAMGMGYEYNNDDVGSWRKSL